MPRPPELDDYVVLLGWHVTAICGTKREADAAAQVLKRQEPHSRVTVARIVTQLPAQEDV